MKHLAYLFLVATGWVFLLCALPGSFIFTFAIKFEPDSWIGKGCLYAMLPFGLFGIASILTWKIADEVRMKAG